MNSNIVPMICGAALAIMSAAGVSHWWSVRQFVVAFHSGLPIPAIEVPKVVADPSPALAVKAPKVQTPVAKHDAGQQQFYEALIAKIENLQNQNRDLVDQMAETNRDVMKLEFRVDTHSESFRPMPVSEELRETTYDEGSGVLPPRAEPVFLPSDE